MLVSAAIYPPLSWPLSTGLDPRRQHFDECADLHECIAVNMTPLILVSDHYLHLDVTDDYDAVKLLHGLTQHVLQPTHDRGHTLDVFITRSDQSVLSLNVDPPALSDHSSIVAIVDLQVFHRYTVSRIAWRCWRGLLM